jgi:hypothetical protein
MITNNLSLAQGKDIYALYKYIFSALFALTVASLGGAVRVTENYSRFIGFTIFIGTDKYSLNYICRYLNRQIYGGI